jgi:dephospho-CoA kinase
LYQGRPIIGIAGGIGSGKSSAARIFGEMGCAVIDSDAQVREAYESPAVRETIRNWWGEAVFAADGKVNRRAVAERVFASPEERTRLEGLLHPLVAAARDREMAKAAGDKKVLAFVWDTPLLFEAGLSRQCDAIVFIDTDLDQRLSRVAITRGWNEEELHRRENFQWGLDKKRSFSDYVLRNDSNPDEFRRLIGETLSQVLTKTIR